jgi:dTMP kinase
MNRGRFISLEGGEGSGKSTQARSIQAFLEERGIKVVLTREPGGSPGAELIRELLVQGEVNRWDPLSEYLLFSASRRDHLLHTIWPSLEKGWWVICDRFYDSSRAYQGAGGGVDAAFLERVYQKIAGDFLPDLTLIFDLPPEGGLERTQGRLYGEDRFEKMGFSFHQRVREGFLAIARQEPERCKLIHANCSPEEVRAQIYVCLEERFFCRTHP